jgi:hypothetical protein
MGNTSPDPQTIGPTLTLVGGVLSFSAVVIGIINAKLQKAKSAAAKERVISEAFGVASAGFPLLGIVLTWGLEQRTAGLCSWCLGTVFVSLGYLRTTAPPRRAETLVLVASWCATTSMLIFDLLRGQLALIDGIVKALRP